MQNRYTLIALFFALLFTKILSAQTTYLCAGEQVTLEAGANYWGTPQWEYSSDGVTWNTIALQPTFSFTLNTGNSGLYRLSYTADDCSYFSETKEIRALVDSFTIRSFFSDNAIPNDADPVFWYESIDSLSQITYFLNGAAVATTNALLQQIENPGANFEIYATAVNQQGCSVVSPVYACTVYDSAQTGNGDLQLPLSALNDGVLISSSVDSVNVNANGPFTIDYSYSMGFDLVFASRPSQPVNQQLLGITVIYDEQANFVMSSENSALAMVLTLQDITNTARVYPNPVISYIQQSALFPAVVSAIDAQLNAAGYINYADTNLWQLVRAVGEEVVSGLFPTLFDACLVPNTPSIEIFPNHLSFNHCGINTAYFARFYNHDNQAVSKPILFLGDGQSVFTNEAFSFVGNILLTDPNMAALFNAYKARINDELTASDLSTFVLFDELSVRLTNGNDINSKPEDLFAESYNDFSFLISLTSATLGSPAIIKKFGQTIECGYSYSQLLYQTYDEIVKPSITESPFEAANVLFQFNNSFSAAVEDCSPQQNSNFKRNYLKTSATLGQFSELGWMVQFLYDWHSKESRVKYVCTKAGNRWMGKLKVVSNANLPFYGVPSSLAYNSALPTNEKPFFKLVETDVYATTDNGGYLWENDFVPISNLEGITCFGLFTNTENLTFNSQTYQGLGFSDMMFGTNQNDIFWRFAKNASTPSEATLNVNFKFNDQIFPNYIEGLQNGLAYVGIIESPQLLINEGSNNQSGAANSFLPLACNVTLVGASGRPARDCDVEFEVIQGGGALQNYSPWPDDGESSIKVINTGFDYGPLFSALNGMAGVKWRLGQSGDQKLKVTYKPNGIALTSVQIDATFAPLSVTYSGFISYEQAVWNTPSTTLHAVGGVPPYQYDFFENCDSWSTDSVIQYPADGIVMDGCGNENFRLGGQYLMRVRDAVGSIATVLVYINREWAAVSTTGTLCVPSNGGYVYQSNINISSPDACFNLQNSQYLIVHVVGSNIPGLWYAGGMGGSGGTLNNWNDIVNGTDTTDMSFGASALTIPSSFNYACTTNLNTFVHFRANDTGSNCPSASCSYRVRFVCPSATNAASPSRWIWSNVITHNW